MTARGIGIALVALGLLALLLLPPLFGRLTQRAVEARIAAIDASEPLEARIDAYERGWFRSRARLTVAPVAAAGGAGAGAASPIAPGAPSAPGAPGAIRVVVDFEHGPVSLEHGFFFGFVQIEARPEPAAGTATAYPFRFDARTSLGGELRFAAELPALDRQTAAAHLSFSGGRLVGSLRRSRLTAHGTAATLRLEQAAGSLSLRGVELTTESALASGGAAVNKATLKAEGASLESADSTRELDATVLAVNAQGTIDAMRLLEGTLEISADTMHAGEEGRIGSPRLHGRIRRLDLRALRDYSDAARRIEANVLPPEEAADVLEPSIHALLAAGPSLEIETLELSFDGEPLEVRAEASVDKAALPQHSAVDLLAVDFWTRILEARADVSASKVLVERAVAAVLENRLRRSGSPREQQIAPIAQGQAAVLVPLLALRGYLENAGNRYKSALRLEHGKLTVNGKRVALPGD